MQTRDSFFPVVDYYIVHWEAKWNNSQTTPEFWNQHKTEPWEVPNIQCAVLTRVAGIKQEISGGEAEP